MDKELYHRPQAWASLEVPIIGKSIRTYSGILCQSDMTRIVVEYQAPLLGLRLLSPVEISDEPSEYIPAKHEVARNDHMD